MMCLGVVGQQVGGFVLVAHMLGCGGVAFEEDEVTNHPEASFPEGGKETVGFRPAIEAHRETVWFEHPVQLGKGGLEPCIIIVVRHPASIAGTVADKIGLVGEDKIGTALWKCGQ